MDSFTAPADLLYDLLQPWSSGRAFLTPEVWIEGHPRTDATFYLTRIVSTSTGQGHGSIALDKLCHLADYAKCSLVLPTTSFPKSSDASVSREMLYQCSANEALFLVVRSAKAPSFVVRKTLLRLTSCCKFNFKRCATSACPQQD